MRHAKRHQEEWFLTIWERQVASGVETLPKLFPKGLNNSQPQRPVHYIAGGKITNKKRIICNGKLPD